MGMLVSGLCGLQPVSYISLGLTLGTGFGLLYYYRHLKENKLKRETPQSLLLLYGVCLLVIVTAYVGCAHT